MSLIASSPTREIKLRRYQIEMVAKLYNHVRGGKKRILMVAIMGAGKTVIAAWIMRDAVKKGRRCVFLVALNVLIDQTVETLRALGVTVTVLQGDRPVDPDAQVIVASLQTIKARLRKGRTLTELFGHVDVIFADEAHVTSFDAGYEEIEEYYSVFHPETKFIGLSATPWRLSKKEWLGQKYDAVVEGPQPPEVVQMGGALPCRGFTLTGAINLDKLHERGGDFIDTEVAAQATRPEALKYVVTEWKRICPDRPTLAICATVNQAEMQKDCFIQHGISAELIVGSTPKEERKAIFEWVKSGKTQIIVSVGCLTAGFDLPCISAILYIRATKSKALFFQSAGRGSRTSEGKQDYILLDFGGNLRRFGNPMAWQVYDISEPAKEDNPAPSKTCPECKAEINQFLRVCPHCGFEFCGEEQVSEQEQEELVLTQLNEYCDRFTREKIQKLRQWRKASYQADLSPDDAIARFHSEYGHNPPPEWLLHACLTKRYSPRRQAEFAAWLWNHCNTQSRWAKQWIAYHLRLEFGTESLDTAQWWDILNIEPGSSWEQVKAAYSQLSANFDPSCYAGDDAREQVERLNLALEDAKEHLSAIAVQGGAV